MVDEWMDVPPMFAARTHRDNEIVTACAYVVTNGVDL
jgi:hypothetical protein